MTHIVGEHDETEPIRIGSSRPKLEETLEQKIAKRITPELIFKFNSKRLDVAKISDKNILHTRLFEKTPKQEWNCEYEGEARIYVSAENGITSEVRKIKGYVLIEDNEIIKMSEIQITKLYG